MGKFALPIAIFVLLCTPWTSSGVAVGPLDISDNNSFDSVISTFESGLHGFNTAEDDSPASRFRLPNQIIPRHYKLEIRPILTNGDLAQFTAPGVVQITVECMQPTRELVLHAADLAINSTTVKVWRSGAVMEPVLPIVDMRFNTVNETFTIQMEDILVLGQRYEIYIEYRARIPPPEERMNGLYRSFYTNDLWERTYLATTQFSRTRAFRKTLPSFDEPSQKATFEISVGRQDSYHTLSNMDIKLSEPITGLSGWTWDRYNTTPVMSPTIIAFIVSDFVSETADPALFHPNKPCKIWGPAPEMKDGGGVFAAETAAKSLKYFEEYFGIEYELPKIDSAAIPHFAAGAMENWGLNTYRIPLLIWKEGINTATEKFSIGRVIGHELAHQYWGNLVTHAWWNDWWLTEGFASYFQFRSLDTIGPQYEGMDRHITMNVQAAMAFDASTGSVPIHGEVDWDFVENPGLINYQKGAALVNMMRGFMTEDVFRKAVSYYLRRRSYLAVSQDALFDDLTEYLRLNNQLPRNNKTINEIMNTWTLQKGFPLVRVARAGQNSVFLSQERFEHFIETGFQPNTASWHIPISYLTKSQPAFNDSNNLPKLWMDKEVLLTTHEVDTNQWILVNPNGQGYYRVLYDNHLSSLLRTQLENDFSVIPVGSRSMIVDDYFTAAYQGYIPVTDALNMAKFMESETELNVWIPYMKHMRKTYEMSTSVLIEYEDFRMHILLAMRKAFEKIGYKQEPNELAVITMTRVQLFDWACPLFDPGCVAEANLLMQQWRDDPNVNPIPLDIRAHIYCASASETPNWDFLTGQYELTRDPSVRNALACSDKVSELQGVLVKASLDVAISSGDAIAFFQRVATNSNGRTLVIGMLVNRFTHLVGPTRLGPEGVAQVISTLATYTRNTFDLDTLKDLVEVREEFLTGQMENIRQSLARIEENIKWMNNFGSSIATWLRPFGKEMPNHI